MLTQINNVHQAVKNILLEFPETRDNDRLLLLKVWAMQEPKLRDPNFPFRIGFGVPFVSGKFVDPESVRRARQRIQEELPHLRGEAYKGRQKQADKIRKEFSRYE